jgi:hypothetical protein
MARCRLTSQTGADPVQGEQPEDAGGDEGNDELIEARELGQRAEFRALTPGPEREQRLAKTAITCASSEVGDTPWGFPSSVRTPWGSAS